VKGEDCAADADLERATSSAALLPVLALGGHDNASTEPAFETKTADAFPIVTAPRAN
jgi:hypothetical protein